MTEFYIPSDGIRLHAKLERPEGAEKCPLVILVHGLTGHMEERHILAAARTMLEAGYAVLRVEMYGHGGSEGEFRKHTMFKWIGNIMDVTDYARSLDFVTDLVLCGHSQGGLLTVLAGGMRTDAYKALIPLSPAVSIPDMARKGVFFDARFDPDHVPDEVDVGYYFLDGDYFRCAQLIHPEDAVRRYPGPVLIVHGEADEAIPISWGRDTAALYRNCRLAVIPDDLHCYDRHVDLMAEAIRSFLLDLKQK